MGGEKPLAQKDDIWSPWSSIQSYLLPGSPKLHSLDKLDRVLSTLFSQYQHHAHKVLINSPLLLCRNSFLFFLLEYNCFTMLCWFLLYNEVNQLCIYIHISPPSWDPFSTPIPPSRSSQSTKLSSLCFIACSH